jgi:hypothetical protein
MLAMEIIRASLDDAPALDLNRSEATLQGVMCLGCGDQPLLGALKVGNLVKALSPPLRLDSFLEQSGRRRR